MAAITKTTIGTSPTIDICEGLALFPFGTARAGITSGDGGATFLNVQLQILAWRLGAGASWSLFAGVCGPAYAILFDAEGETTGSTVELAITNDHVQAGFVVGFNFGAQFNFGLQQNSPKWIWDGWHSHFADNWSSVFNAGGKISLDLINLILTVVTMFLKESGKTDTLLQSTSKFLPSLIGSWGLFDDKRAQFATNNGTWSVNPTFQLPINLVPLTADIPGLDVLYGADRALSTVMGYLRLGPTLGLSIPVTIKTTQITVDEQVYDNLQASGGKVTGTGGTATVTPKTVGVRLDHTPGFSISVGFFFAVGALKLFNLSATHTFDLLAALGIKIQFGTYRNSLASPIGGTPPPPPHAHHAHLDHGAPLEIVFEPAEI